MVSLSRSPLALPGASLPANAGLAAPYAKFRLSDHLE